MTLNRPEARNALNSLLMQELTEIARGLGLRADVLAAILARGGEAWDCQVVDGRADDGIPPRFRQIGSRHPIPDGLEPPEFGVQIVKSEEVEC